MTARCLFRISRGLRALGIAGTAIIGLSTSARAQPASAGPAIIGQRFTLHSAVLNEDRVISVHVPDSYDTDPHPYPVLYVLDGEQLFVPMVGVADALEWAFRAPPLIVVAIHNRNRARDLATSGTSPVAKGSSEPTAAQAGGADRFLSFIETELLPEIDRRYRTSHFRILFGHSLGGLFALHTFTTRPGLFTAVIASSPPAFWNGDEEITRLRRVFAEDQRLTGYLSVSRAAKEFDDTPRAVGTIEELVRLRAPASLHAVVRTIPATDHGTVLLSAVQGGLELAFVGWRLPSLVFDEGLDSIEVYYQQRSAEYGFPVPIPEGEISALARRLEPQDVQAGARAYARYAALYPESLSALLGVADTDARLGRLNAADTALAHAISLAQSQADPRLPAIRARRDSLARVRYSQRR